MAGLTKMMAVLTQREEHFAAPGALNRPTIFHNIRVTHAGYFPRKESWLHHRFGMYAIGLVTSGCGTYRVGRGRVQAVEPGSYFTVYPGPQFHYGPDPGIGWEEHYIGVVGRGVTRWIKNGLFPTDGIVRRVEDTTALVESMRDVLRVLQRSERGDADRAVLMTERVVLELNLAHTAPPGPKRTSSAMELILAHCRAHLAEDINFEALADEHAMSYSHLRQQMRRLTGVAPAHYLTRLRCQAACGFLNGGDETIKAIGRRVGIADPYAFSRVFRRTIGVSPQQYREQNAQWRR